MAKRSFMDNAKRLIRWQKKKWVNLGDKRLNLWMVVAQEIHDVHKNMHKYKGMARKDVGQIARAAYYQLPLEMRKNYPAQRLEEALYAAVCAYQLFDVLYE